MSAKIPCDRVRGKMAGTFGGVEPEDLGGMGGIEVCVKKVSPCFRRLFILKFCYRWALALYVP